jgi:hypothetical protein
MLFRASRASSCTQAALRLHISREENNTVVRILKRRGGGIPAPVALDLHNALLRRTSPTRREPFARTPEAYVLAPTFSTH